MSEHGPTAHEARAARAGVDPVVFFIAAGISLAFVLWGVIDVESVGKVADDVLTWIISTFGWVFVIGTAGFLVFAGSSPSAASGACGSAATTTGPSSARSPGSR